MAAVCPLGYDCVMRQTDGSSDRRWILLAEDGSFSTLGRDADPTSEKIQTAEDLLRGCGFGGWLAVMSGSPHDPIAPTLMEVRPLANPRRRFSDAAADLLAAL